VLDQVVKIAGLIHIGIAAIDDLPEILHSNWESFHASTILQMPHGEKGNSSASYELNNEVS
jgi:hypothetical protein